MAGGAALAGNPAGGRTRSQARPETRPACYLPGDTIDPEVFVLDTMRRPLRLLDIARLDAKAVVLVLFGGAYLTTTDKHGGIWCEDSLDDFALQKAAVHRFSGEGVQFIGVACPPVYSDRYGYEKHVFLDEPEDSPKYVGAVERFIEKTEALRRDHTIPLPTVAYDARFRLLWNAREHAALAAYGRVHPWQGRFRWHKDEQRYGTPCIWFLDRAGKVLREPLYGNNYSSAPPHIAYTYWELEAAIGEALGAAKRAAAAPRPPGGAARA
jgi:hypothetical protein